jgi:hypothetical protein
LIIIALIVAVVAALRRVTPCFRREYHVIGVFLCVET